MPVSAGVLDGPECPIVVTNPSGVEKEARTLADGLRKQGRALLGMGKGGA